MTDVSVRGMTEVDEPSYTILFLALVDSIYIFPETVLSLK